MSTKALLLELLISGFFAIACLKARAGTAGNVAVKPRDFLRLVDRMERLSRTRWQWFAMVLVLVFVRLQSKVPLTIELTAVLQFVIFLCLPTHEKEKGKTAVNKVRRESFSPLIPRHVSSGKV